MMLTNPIHDFLKKASPHAKQCKIRELNYLEAELIMMQEEIINLNKNGALPGDIGFLIQKIDELKNVVKGKRNDLAVNNVSVPGKMINSRPARNQ
jgi:hypothetical protein